MDKSYRVHTNIGSDRVLNVQMRQDVNLLEILTMKITEEDTYKLHQSGYGVIVGRVLANDAFGIPNAKVSVFMKLSDEDANNKDITEYYPYKTVQTQNSDGIRYNLLPDESNDDCYRVVGTFPNKRLVLDDDSVLEVYDKYWKYTTVTNHAGDYMIYGVPTGNQQIHVDVDLSDIGVLSQKPRDMVYKGYNAELFDNASQFKESTNLDSLTQIISQDQSVYVYPFWGDEELGDVAITRSDIQIQYKFEPTCVFFGAVVTDSSSNVIGHKCNPTKTSGYNNKLVTAEGTIEMIRKTPDGYVEEFQIQGNRLIDTDGVFCYQIPMNLDFVGTDEYGNIVPTDNPSKGIATRTRVRFRFSIQETGDEGVSNHRAKYLVPNNPRIVEGKVYPMIENGQDYIKCFEFGSATPDEYFRDLYWNKVYSVKNYIPRTQVARRVQSANFNALRSVNFTDEATPIPFNKLRFRLPFVYVLVCLILAIVVYIITFINKFIICPIEEIFYRLSHVCIDVGFTEICPFGWIDPKLACIHLDPELTDEVAPNTMYIPGCTCRGGSEYADCPDDMSNCEKVSSSSEAIDRIQQVLSQDFEVTNFDFYNDWLNGTLYMPLWYWRRRKKKKFFFGLFSKSAVNEFCSCEKEYSRLKVYFPCDTKYQLLDGNTDFINSDDISDSDEDWDTEHKSCLWPKYGLIREFKNKDGLNIYYYTPGNPTDRGDYVTKYLETTYDRYNGPVGFIRLFATDIILMGSFNDCDMDGIPKFFTRLPSTTALIPFIATVSEPQSSLDAEQEEASNKGVKTKTEDSGTSIVTGIDWEKDGKTDRPKYEKGLFVDLGCTSVGTRIKSCVNAERLCELGVGFDLKATEYSVRGGSLDTYDQLADGLITRYELVDNESRAMFASMNHNGFNPVEGYTIEKENTSFDFYRFRYLYPVDFDGRLKRASVSYTNGAAQRTYDTPSLDYKTFRFGSRRSGEFFHFYRNEGGDHMFPLYNNSFYFYFGLNEGSTAIDKFNKTFYAECFKNEKFPFTVEVQKSPARWCPKSIQSDYGQMIFYLDDIIKPYSYELYDQFDNLIITEINMETDEIVIGGVADRTDKYLPKYQKEGSKFKKNGQITCLRGEADCELNTKPNGDPYLVENGTYKIKITDANRKSVTKIVNLQPAPISVAHTEYDLSRKFYNRSITTGPEICDPEKEYYGELHIGPISIDGIEYNIAGIESEGKEGASTETEGVPYIYYYILNLWTYYEGNYDTQKIKLTVAPSEKEPKFDANGNAELDENGFPKYGFRQFIECSCDVGYEPPRDNRIQFGPLKTTKELIIDMYFPATYTITATQFCNGELRDNSTTTTAEIKNGTNLMAYINDVPLRMLIGRNDLKQTTLNKYFNNAITRLNGASKIPITQSGWLHLEDEFYYAMHGTGNIDNGIAGDLALQVNDRNEELWSEFTDIVPDGEMTVEEKYGIIAKKFNYIFKMCEGAYISQAHNNRFAYSTTGGRQAVINRGYYPMYLDILHDNSESNPFKYYEVDSIGYVSAIDEYPNIIGPNYRKYDRMLGSYVPLSYFRAENGRYYRANTMANGEGGAYPNSVLANGEIKQGNYFAAFTNNAAKLEQGKKCSEDTTKSKKIERYPFNTDTLINGLLQCKTAKRDMLGVNDLVEKAGHSLPGSAGKAEPYFKAMFVDRRFDYDLKIWLPSNISNQYGGGRITGYTYNGIEMVYDLETYEIIGEGDDYEYEYVKTPSAVDFGKITYHGYNGKQKFMVCEVETSTVLDLQKDPNRKIEQKYYINGHAIYPYVNQIDTSNDMELHIDTGSELTFTVVSCSYGIKASSIISPAEGGGQPSVEVSAIAKEGERVSFTLGCSPHTKNVNTVQDAMASQHADFTYADITEQDGPSGSHGTAKTGEVSNASYDSFTFSLLPDGESARTHRSRTGWPRFVEIENIDDIKKIKLEAFDADFPAPTWQTVFSKDMPEGVSIRADEYPDDINFGDADDSAIGVEAFRRGNSYMYDTDTSFQQMTFSFKKTTSVLGINMTWSYTLEHPIILIRLDRMYYNKASDNLTKSIHVVDLNSVIDVRPFYIVNETEDQRCGFKFRLYYGAGYDILTWREATETEPEGYYKTGENKNKYTNGFGENCDYGFCTYINGSEYKFLATVSEVKGKVDLKQGGGPEDNDGTGDPSLPQNGGNYQSLLLSFKLDDLVNTSYDLSSGETEVDVDVQNVDVDGHVTVSGTSYDFQQEGSGGGSGTGGGTTDDIEILRPTAHLFKCYFSMTNGVVVSFQFYTDRCGQGIYKTYNVACEPDGDGICQKNTTCCDVQKPEERDDSCKDPCKT